MQNAALKNPGTKPAVLITGCSSGLGHALARCFVQAGHPTYATARRADAIADLETVGCQTLTLDVTDEASIKAAINIVERDCGAVGILINNAGIGLMSPMEIAPMADVRNQYETNVFGLLAVTQAALPAMRNAGTGRILNIGSSGGEFTTPTGGVYQATKNAVDSMTDAMRMELKQFGIDVVLIEPGAISSKFGVNGGLIMDENGPYAQLMRGVKKITSQALASGAPGTWSPDELAQVVLRASTTRRPKSRYRPGIVAKSLIHLRAWMPDRLWDYMFMSQLIKAGKKPQ